jgi:hypothetical protein
MNASIDAIMVRLAVKLLICSVLLFALSASFCEAQFGGPDVFGATWNISIQITGVAQAPSGTSIAASLSEVLALSSGQVIKEQTSGDVIPSFLSSGGFGNWTYVYNATDDAGVKFISLITTSSGAPVGIRTTVLRLTPSQDSLSVTGSYKATLVDTNGNVIYQVNGTLTGVALRVDIADEQMT